MKNAFMKIVFVIISVLMVLSAISCGKDLSAYKGAEENGEDEEEIFDGWSIYIYLIGSDLEDRDLDQLSSYTKYLVEDEAKAEDENYKRIMTDRVRAFSEEIIAMGADAPSVFYNRNQTEEEEAEKNTDPDAMGYATYSLDLMLESDISENVRFIIQTGGAKRWESPLVNANRSQVFLIDCDGIVEISNEPVVNMADPETLEEFAVFCKDYFPSKYEMFLFWDHGGAYSGFGIDDIYGTDMFNIREMTGAFGNVKRLFTQDGPLFDVIAFDACLMANLETAHLFADYADYYYASAEEMSGLGYGYDRIIEAIAENPDITPYELGEKVADANVANVQLEDYDDLVPATFSVIDLREIDALYDAYAELIKKALKLSIADVKNLTEISKAASGTLAYAYGSSGGFNLIDLQGFMENLSDFMPEETQKVLELLPAAVKYLNATTYFKDSGGMSVYFPAKMTAAVSLRRFLTYMYDFSDNPDMDALFYYKIAGCLNEKLSQYVYDQGYGEAELIDFSILGDIPYLEVEVDGEGNMSMEIPEEMRELIQSVCFGLTYIDEETGDTLSLGEIPIVSIDENGTVTTDFDLMWPTLEENELPAELLSDDGKTIIYRVPIYYYDLDCYLVFYFDKASGKYSIGGLTLDSDNGSGTADRTVIEMDEEDEFSVEYEYSNMYSSIEDSAYIDFIYTKDMTIDNMHISDGVFIEYLKFSDLRSDVYYSPMVVLVTEDGEVADQYVDYDIVSFDYGE